ncbi:MAG: DMT family transporter [Candidatus Kuenenbacteria bacterium]
MGEKWMKWTLLEASTKTLSKLLQKIIGKASAILPHAFLAIWIVGLVQTIAGFMMAKARKKKLLTDRASIIGSCWFGFNATACTVICFIVFMLKGDIGVNTLIITLSIIPGALIDRFFFGHHLNRREWFGVLIAILAGYSVLGWPSLSSFLTLPLWIVLSFIVMILVAINQGITQKIRKIDPFVKNFWGGFTTFLLALIALIVMKSQALIFNFSLSTQKLWWSSALIGLIIVGMWSFNLMSYKGGAHIAIKKLVMNGTYLITAMLLGIVLFNESLSLAKASGVILYLLAFILMDKGVWNSRWKKLTK